MVRIKGFEPISPLGLTVLQTAATLLLRRIRIILTCGKLMFECSLVKFRPHTSHLWWSMGDLNSPLTASFSGINCNRTLVCPIYLQDTFVFFFDNIKKFVLIAVSVLMVCLSLRPIVVAWQLSSGAIVGNGSGVWESNPFARSL